MSMLVACGLQFGVWVLSLVLDWYAEHTINFVWLNASLRVLTYLGKYSYYDNTEHNLFHLSVPLYCELNLSNHKFNLLALLDSPTWEPPSLVTIIEYHHV
jgi:hypothetical protein